MIRNSENLQDIVLNEHRDEESYHLNHFGLTFVEVVGMEH